MRLTHITQTPRHQRNDADRSGAMEHVTVFHIQRVDHLNGFIKTAGMQHDNDRGQQQGENHQGCLNGIGPAHRQKTANEYV